mgnify:CR=1 FL=1
MSKLAYSDIKRHEDFQRWSNDCQTSMDNLMELSMKSPAVRSSESLCAFIAKDEEGIIPGRLVALGHRFLATYDEYAIMFHVALHGGMETYHFNDKVHPSNLCLDPKVHKFDDCDELVQLKVWYKLTEPTGFRALKKLYEKETRLILELWMRPDSYEPVSVLFCFASDD